MHVREMKDGLRISLQGDVAKIEVEKIDPPDEDDDDEFPSYFRTIRITSVGGNEVIELFCSGSDEESLELKHVKKLGPIGKPDPDEPTWLSPVPKRSKQN